MQRWNKIKTNEPAPREILRLEKVNDVCLVEVDVRVRVLPEVVTRSDGDVIRLRRVRGGKVVLQPSAHFRVLGKVLVFDDLVLPATKMRKCNGASRQT